MARRGIVVEMVDPTTLSLAPWNPRQHTERGLNAVDESLREFGWVEPVVVWNNYVVNGNARLKRALSRGESRIPVVRRDDLTEEQAKRYTLVANRIPQLMIDDEEKVYELAKTFPQGVVSPFYTEDELEEKRNYLEALLRARAGEVREDLNDGVRDSRRRNEEMLLTLRIPFTLWEAVGDIFDDWFKEQIELHPEIAYTKKKRGG